MSRLFLNYLSHLILAETQRLVRLTHFPLHCHFEGHERLLPRQTIVAKNELGPTTPLKLDYCNYTPLLTV